MLAFTMRASGILVAFVLSAAAALSPRALAAEPKVPGAESLDIALKAEHLDLDLESRKATMTGGVTITRGALELRCPRVDVRYDEAGAQPQGGQLRVTWVKGTGGVVATVKGVRAEAPEVELDVAGQTMALKGGVRVTQGAGWITAERATVHLTTGKVSMTDVKGSLPVGSAPAEPKR
jgi:lipopolysaccharide export system protein LptA